MVSEQSRKPRVKCRQNGELYGGRRAFARDGVSAPAGITRHIWALSVRLLPCGFAAGGFFRGAYRRQQGGKLEFGDLKGPLV